MAGLTSSPGSRRRTIVFVGLANETFRKFHRRWVEKLIARGHSVTWIAEDWGDQAVLREAGIPSIAIPVARDLDPVKMVQYWRTLRRHLMVLKPDVLVSEGTLPGLLARLPSPLIPRMANVHVLHSFPWHDQSNLVSKAAGIIAELLAQKRTSATLMISKEDFEEGLRIGILDQERARYLPVGINPDYYGGEPSAVEIETARAALGLGAGERAMLFVGRIVQYKGPFDALKAFEMVAARHQDLVLVLVGHPDRRPNALRDAKRLEALMRASQFKDRIRHVPFVADLRAVYATAAVFVMPSLYEGLGLVYLEAGSQGVPCIGYNVRGVREAIFPEHNGLLVPAGDVNGIAQAVERILGDPSLHARLSKNGRRQWMKFSNETFANGMVETIERVE